MCFINLYRVIQIGINIKKCIALIYLLERHVSEIPMLTGRPNSGTEIARTVS